MNGTIAVAASFAQKPLQGGHSWVLLQYLLGFRRLGWEVLLIDVLTAEMCFDAAGNPCSLEHSINLAVLNNVMNRFGLEDNFVLLFNNGERYIGKSRKQVLNLVDRSVVLLNIMGFLDDEEIISRASKHVFLDIDPGFGQMWESLGLARIFDGYDDYVTIGENVGLPECKIPDCGKSWITTAQPIVLEYWPVRLGPHNRGLTSIVSWRGAYGPVTYEGKTYGLRAHEFRKFSTLPNKTGRKFQLALNIHADDSADLDRLRHDGWSIVEPATIAGDPWSYQSFIQDSDGEIMIAKNLYVDTRSGWFSDRSICYLASGKPVLAQDTGLRARYPSGEGLVWFNTLEEAIDGVAQIYLEYDHHAQAARNIAETYFDSDKVLGKLLSKLGVD